MRDGAGKSPDLGSRARARLRLRCGVVVLVLVCGVRALVAARVRGCEE